MGRLFDGVAGIIGLRQTSRFEGDAAMSLEFAAEGRDGESPYAFAIDSSDCLRLDWRPMIRELASGVKCGADTGCLAVRFHNTLVEMAVQIARLARMKDVVLSGGCFQNRVLTERMIAGLRAEGFCVWWNRQVPPNDGGLALGQIAAAFRENGAM
jgi:hydrogenase maturation protein HypF